MYGTAKPRVRGRCWQRVGLTACIGFAAASGLEARAVRRLRLVRRAVTVGIHLAVRRGRGQFPVRWRRDPCGNATSPRSGRYRHTWSERAAQLDGVTSGHRVTNGPGDRELHFAQVQDRDVDVESIGDVADALVEHGVARDPHDAVALAVPTQGEADHITDDRAASGGPGDTASPSPRSLACRRFESRDVPRIEATHT